MIANKMPLRARLKERESASFFFYKSFGVSVLVKLIMIKNKQQRAEHIIIIIQRENECFFGEINR